LIPNTEPGAPRAAIVDQLALTDPNGAFVASVTNDLRSAGYEVDYFAPDMVTVDLYRTLPSRGYRLVIIRGHSSNLVSQVDQRTGQVHWASEVMLFTNELYSPMEHTEDRASRTLGVVAYEGRRQFRDRYLAIRPKFVRSSMTGRFDGAVVLLMGCAGLSSTSFAEALIARGASYVVSWDGLVTAEFTDRASALFLASFAHNPPEVASAVMETRQVVGADPIFGSSLSYFPQ
jgi:hypothetical protein